MQLYLGDCLDILPTLPDKSVDMVLCDLPYGTTQNKWDSVIDLAELWLQYKRACKGAIVLTAQTPFDKVLGVSNLGWLRYEWIWKKNIATGHLNAKKMPLKAHENVLVFYKNLPTYNPLKTSGHKRVVLKERRCDSSNYGKQTSSSYDSGDKRYPQSILEYPADRGLHPTQKPVALMEYLIRTYTNPGDVVLDNCAGSGSTGVAALQSGRQFIGIERELEYWLIAHARLSAIDTSVSNA